MKIVCISDIHSQLIDIPECDVLLIAEDITPGKLRTSKKELGKKIELEIKGKKIQFINASVLSQLPKAKAFRLEQ